MKSKSDERINAGSVVDMSFLIFFLERAGGAVQVRMLRYDNLADLWQIGASKMTTLAIK